MVDLSSRIQTDYKAVDKRDELRTVMGWLAGEASKVPIVTDCERPFGILNERALMARQLDERSKIARYTLATRALVPEDSIEEARARMMELRAAYLPVEDERQRPMGYVRAIDVARETAGAARAAQVAVPVTTLREGATMGDAVNAFQKEYVDYLPVLGDNGHIAGVLPRRAVLRAELHTADRGRKDAGGEKRNMIHDPLAPLLDPATSFLPARASLDEVLATLEDQGYALVSGNDGVVLGIVTPETLFQ